MPLIGFMMSQIKMTSTLSCSEYFHITFNLLSLFSSSIHFALDNFTSLAMCILCILYYRAQSIYFLFINLMRLLSYKLHSNYTSGLQYMLSLQTRVVKNIDVGYSVLRCSRIVHILISNSEVLVISHMFQRGLFNTEYLNF